MNTESKAPATEVTVTVQHKPACRVEFHVTAPKSLVEQSKKEAVKAVNKEVEIPGFRKGKAPNEMILKKFPKDVEKASHKALADLAFQEARKIAKVPLLTQNAKVNFDLKHMTDEGAELVFIFETEPTVPAVDPKQFAPKPISRHEVGEKQINEAIRQMRFFYAQWAPIDGRTVQEGDFVMIHLDTLEGETPQRVFNNIRFEVVPERMAHWMRTLVLNAKAGDVLDGVSQPDENATEEEKTTFQPKKVRLHLLKVEEATLPALDDEFAKKVGAPNVDALKEMVSNILHKKVEDEADHQLREQVNHFLTETYPFELPFSLVENELKHRFGQMIQDPKFRERWGKMAEADRSEFAQKMEKEAAAAIRLFFLSRQAVSEAKIPVTNKEVQDVAVDMLRDQGKQADAANIPQEIFAHALSKVLLAKAQDWIIAAPKDLTNTEQ